MFLFLSACAGASVRIEPAPGFDASGLRTYAWVPGAATGLPAHPRIDSASVDSMVRLAVDGALAARGYSHAAEGSDFLVDYHVVITRRTVEAVAPVHCPEEPPLVSLGAEDRYCREYDEGALVLDVLDPASGMLLWRGVARREIDWTLTPAEVRARIENAVGRVVGRFPRR
jgi:hypothetical protein